MSKIIVEKPNIKIHHILLSILIIAIGIFWMSRKEDLDIDEVFTFGLANNTYQLDIEDFKEYDGNELLLHYAAVKDGEEFNVKNVFFNQKMDTHPPLYYLLVNFVSSIRKGTFSMWHGLIINLVFMLALFWEMQYFFNLIINDKLMSSIFSIIAFFTYGMINEIVFIRMYVVLSVISMAFAILIIEKIKSYQNNGINPYVTSLQFFLICVLGILTQYHFAIIALYFSIVFGLFLIYKKEFKTLFLIILSGALSIVVSILIFPGMINHIFGESSLHAVNGEQIYSLSKKFFEILRTVYRSFFGVGIIPYIFILVIAIVLAIINLIKNKSNIKNVISNNKWFFITLFACIFYYVAIPFTIKYTFARYLYNIYSLIIVCIISSIYLLFKSIKPMLKYISLVVIIMLTITSRLNTQPFSLNVGNNKFYEFLKNNSDTKILALYRSKDKQGRFNSQDTSLWKIQRPIYTFRAIKNISFVDISSHPSIMYRSNDSISNNNRLFILIYTDENDNEILSNIMQNNGFTNISKIIDTTYYHMYLISK